jgi:DNA-binding transcriptional LysR family regulator
MELRHLHSFIAVAEQLNFTHAAFRLHIAQPPLSRRIRQLEEEIGVQLFVRNRRSVKLTDAGRTLLEEARILVAQATHFLDAARQAREGETGLVRIGIGLGMGERINRVLVEHSRRFPAVEIQCQGIPSSLQNEALREGRIDIGFLRPPVDPAHVLSEALFEEQFMVLLPKKSPLAKRKKLRLHQLADKPLLLHPRDISAGVYDKVLDLYRKAGVTPKKLIHTMAFPYEEAGAMLVASGKGIFLGVGAILAHPALGGRVVGVPLDEPEATIEVHVAWRKEERSVTILAFLNSVRNLLKPTSGVLRTVS